MDREFKRVIQEQEQIDRTNNNTNLERNNQLADEVFVFCDKTKLGFKFYNRNPENGSLEAELTGIPPEGVYYTEKIEPAEWDDEINKPGETVPVMYLNGTNKVTTVMVTEQEMIMLLEEIRREEQKESIDGMIIIDLRPREKKINIEQLTRNSFQKMDKENLSEEMKKIGNINELDLNDGIYDNKKDLKDFNF